MLLKKKINDDTAMSLILTGVCKTTSENPITTLMKSSS